MPRRNEGIRSLVQRFDTAASRKMRDSEAVFLMCYAKKQEGKALTNCNTETFLLRKEAKLEQN